MAKVTGQDIPPALVTLWNQLHSQAKATQGASGTIKQKNNTSKPSKKPKRNLDLIALRALAEIVAKEKFTDGGLPIPKNFVFTLTQDLILGIFSPEYFIKCKLETAETLESIPTYSADSNPPPYGFRTPLFMPSVPVYPNGTPTANPPLYTGQKIGTLFADTLLRWRKLAFSAFAVALTGGEKRVLLRWETTITINAAARGSRPMLSLNLAASLSTNTAGAVSSTEPPIMNRTTFYWRFKVPPSAAPFFHSSQVRKEIRVLSRIIKKSGTGLFTRYVLNAANRPMMGRGFNNNNTIDTSFTTDPELWEIDPCLKPEGFLKFRNGGDRWAAAAYNNDTKPFTNGVCPAEMWSCEGVAPFRMAKPVINGAINDDPASWVYLAGHTTPQITLETTNGMPTVLFSGNAGADKDDFTLSGNLLTMTHTINRKTPQDHDLDNVYQTCVAAIDSLGYSGYQKITVTPRNFYNVVRYWGPRYFAYNMETYLSVTPGINYESAAEAEAAARAAMVAIHQADAAAAPAYGGGPGEMPGPPFDFMPWLNSFDDSLLCSKKANIQAIGYSIRTPTQSPSTGLWACTADYFFGTDWGIHWHVYIQRQINTDTCPPFTTSTVDGITTERFTLITDEPYSTATIDELTP